MLILSGDIGGTHCRLACYQTHEHAPPEELASATYPSASADNLIEMVQRFLDHHRLQPQAAGFGLAGPVQGRICYTTNLPWMVDADAIEQQLGIPWVELLNDLEATAWGVAALSPADLLTLQPGAPNAHGNRAIIAAGTGLGQAALYWDGKRHHPFASEGGHCDFAPANEQEIELLRFLQQEYGHVSWERLLSGPGLVNIHRFLCSKERHATPLDPANGDLAAQIANRAHIGDSNCQQAVEIFFRLLAREAANQALKINARGGVYIGGGIAPKNLPWLQRPEFIEHFHAKGRMRALVENMPLHVILNDRIALLGPVGFLGSRFEALGSRL